jgi:hypothetical protein
MEQFQLILTEIDFKCSFNLLNALSVENQCKLIDSKFVNHTQHEVYVALPYEMISVVTVFFHAALDWTLSFSFTLKHSTQHSRVFLIAKNTRVVVCY